jgi:phosphate transport system protein
MSGGHTSHDFEAELRELRGHLLAMGARCERAVQEAVTAFVDRDPEHAREVLRLDERIDRDEMEIDDLAVRVLALRQPVAYDLRFLTTTLKFVTDLERIGHEAVNIAERAEAVLARDDEVDALYGVVLRQVFAWMREHPTEIPAGQAVVSVARYLERVGDHSTNLAEHVVFMVRGDDVRHRPRSGSQVPGKDER